MTELSDKELGAETCICTAAGLPNYEGPQRDCPTHGELHPWASGPCERDHPNWAVCATCFDFDKFEAVPDSEVLLWGAAHAKDEGAEASHGPDCLKCQIGDPYIHEYFDGEYEILGGVSGEDPQPVVLDIVTAHNLYGPAWPYKNAVTYLGYVVVQWDETVGNQVLDEVYPTPEAAFAEVDLMRTAFPGKPLNVTVHGLSPLPEVSGLSSLSSSSGLVQR